jgi:hypothetical protein
VPLARAAAAFRAGKSIEAGMSDPSKSLEMRTTALDSSQGTDARIAAMATLGLFDGVAAKDTILELCERHEEPEELLRAAGRELARVHDAGFKVADFDLRDMAEAAFDAFCE